MTEQEIRILKFGDFATVTNNSLADDNLPENSTVFVATTQPVREQEDLYTLRVKAIVCKVEDEHIVQAPMYMVDPASLEYVDDKTQERLTEVMHEDFDKKEEVEDEGSN